MFIQRECEQYQVQEKIRCVLGVEVEIQFAFENNVVLALAPLVEKGLFQTVLNSADYSWKLNDTKIPVCSTPFIFFHLKQFFFRQTCHRTHQTTCQINQYLNPTFQLAGPFAVLFFYNQAGSRFQWLLPSYRLQSCEILLNIVCQQICWFYYDIIGYQHSVELQDERIQVCFTNQRWGLDFYPFNIPKRKWCISSFLFQICQTWIELLIQVLIMMQIMSVSSIIFYLNSNPLTPWNLIYQIGGLLISEYEQYVTQQLYIIDRMYSNAQQRNKPHNKNIYQIAEKLCEQTDQRNQAVEIMNAYRKVEDIRVPNSNSNNLSKKMKEQKEDKKKPESMYANKVKQTLKQLNANRKKQQQLSKEFMPKPTNQKKTSLGSTEKHLIQSGLKRLIKLVNKKYDQYTKQALRRIVKFGSTSNQQNEESIRLWKLRRVFSGWQYEVMLCKIEKQRIKKQQIQRQKRMTKWAQSFYQFLTYKKVFKSWNKQTKRALKKRQLQLQQALNREEELARAEKTNPIERKKQTQTNVELQSKLRGFLDGLKQQIDGKNKMNTIKQKNEQEESLNNSQAKGQTGPEINNNNQNQNGQVQRKVQDEAVEIQNQFKGPLTNDDLQKRRRQLQKKAKQRKQALDKLKKEKEQKRKQQEQQKIAIQKQIQQEQKRVRQEQYKKFMKLKKQEEDWKIKQKELERQALEFDRLRLMKFYGWVFWIKLKASNLQRCQFMADILNKIILKRKLEKFVSGVCEKGLQNLQKSEQKIDNLYRKKLLKKYVNRLKDWKNSEIQLKQQLSVRHQLNLTKVLIDLQKIYFKQWLRTRSSIQLENYQWERPRAKKAQCLRALTLLHKGFEGFKINRDQQIQNRNVEQHKAKIKEKVHKIVEEKPTINYDDFL